MDLSMYDALSHPSVTEAGYEPRPEIYRDGGEFTHHSIPVTTPFYGIVKDPSGQEMETNVYDIACTTKGDRGPVVLMLHGVPANRKMYYPIQRRLAPFCRTISIDMLGMGESSKPLNYGRRVDKKELGKYDLDMGFGISDDTKPWDWVNDCSYIHQVMAQMFPDEKFIFIADDWGSGINSHYASRYGHTLLAFIQINPIAFDGYPVSEIQAIGRASVIEDEKQFKMAMGAFDQTLVQIFKTMVHKPDNVWNQYSLRAIKGTYVDTDYERKGSDSMTLELKWDAIRVLAERAAILSPDLLLPYDRVKNPKGVNYHDIKVPTLIIWGEKDNMMPPNQAYRFMHALKNSFVEIQMVGGAGHFSATDRPDRVSECILNFLHREMRKNPLADTFIGYTGIWKGDEEEMIEDLRAIRDMENMNGFM